MEWDKKGKSGQEFVPAIVDDFEEEVRSFRRIHRFLDKRAQEPAVPIRKVRKRVLEDV